MVNPQTSVVQARLREEKARIQEYRQTILVVIVVVVLLLTLALVVVYWRKEHKEAEQQIQQSVALNRRMSLEMKEQEKELLCPDPNPASPP